MQTMWARRVWRRYRSRFYNHFSRLPVQLFSNERYVFVLNASHISILTLYSSQYCALLRCVFSCIFRAYFSTFVCDIYDVFAFDDVLATPFVRRGRDSS